MVKKPYGTAVLLDALKYELQNQPALVLQILKLLTYDQSKNNALQAKGAKEVVVPPSDGISQAIDKIYTDWKLLPESEDDIKFLPAQGLPVLIDHKSGDGD